MNGMGGKSFSWYGSGMDQACYPAIKRYFGVTDPHDGKRPFLAEYHFGPWHYAEGGQLNGEKPLVRGIFDSNDNGSGSWGEIGEGPGLVKIAARIAVKVAVKIAATVDITGLLHWLHLLPGIIRAATST